ncbi:MAG: response regulator [Opitutales bacterium]|nr:response regulator [Opitutales bacterium]
MKRKVLTVDDASTMRKMISLTLKAAGYEVLEANDGPEALDMISKMDIDMMILDVNMPKMNGIEVVKRVRRNDRHIKTPIIMLTTETEETIRNEAKIAGATGWINKPFQQDHLVGAVGKVFSMMAA